MADYYVSTKSLSVGYNGVSLIRDISIGVSRGQILTLIGPNGAGKSTILKSIIRQLAPVAGTVILQGKSMSAMTEKEISRVLSVLMTDRIRPELMTCRDVVSTGRYPYTGRLGILSSRDWQAVDEAMALVHAQELAGQSFDRISDGQRQRILLARAICQEPEIIVLDEPTSFLDVRHKLELLSILKKMVRERNVAVIMSLHELDLAQRISDTLVCVRGDTIHRVGTPEEIFRGDEIAKLYGITKGSFNPDFGSVELEPPAGTPEVFVIGGGGSGIGVYRQLQRLSIPFAAGVLAENDLDYPVAAALAGQVVSVPAFALADEAAAEQAKAVIDRCRRVICCPEVFGPANQGNRLLRDYAAGKLCTAEDLK